MSHTRLIRGVREGTRITIDGDAVFEVTQARYGRVVLVRQATDEQPSYMLTIDSGVTCKARGLDVQFHVSKKRRPHGGNAKLCVIAPRDMSVKFA